MPEYLFSNQQTGEVHTVVYHMNEVKDYRGPDGKAKKGVWKRVWTKPRMAVDSVPVDPYSVKDYLRLTNKPGTVGDLHDRSTEMSLARAAKEGRDPVEEKFYENYSKKRHGKKHPNVARREMHESLAKHGIKVTGLDD